MTLLEDMRNSPALRYSDLTPDEQTSFKPYPKPPLLPLPGGTHLYKWTQYPLFGSDGFASVYWSPWESLQVGEMSAPGFRVLRMRYRNREGGVGRPQEFMRARNAVTEEWNTMESITKAELKTEVWGFMGLCAAQPVTKEEEASRKVLFIGGNYQLVLPFMTGRHIFKL